MKIELQTNTPIYQFSTINTLSIFQSRPEIARLVQEAEKGYRHITKDIVGRVLHLDPDAQYDNIIQYLETLGLCDSSGFLKPNVPIQDSKVPIPEYGSFQYWYFKNEGLGTYFLHADYVDAPSLLSDEIESALLTLDQKTFQSVCDKEKLFLPEISKNTKIGPVTKGSISLKISLTEERAYLELHGKIQNKIINQEQKEFNLDWISMVDVWLKNVDSQINFDSTHNIVRVPFSFVKEDISALKDFKMVISLGTISSENIFDIGTFKNVILRDAQIAPKTEPDAQKWVENLFFQKLEKLSTYISRDELIHLFIECIDGTPLENFQLELPSTKELIAKLERNNKKMQVWYLRAASDLNLQLNENERYIYGVSSSDNIHRSKETFHMKNSEISMFELLNVLLDGTSPMKALVIDKHAYQASNAANLHLLIKTLKEFVPNIQIDIVSPKNDKEKIKSANKIGNMKKVSAESSETFFQNGKAPHDRYIYFQINKHNGFGWRLTHTLLHPKANQSTTPEDILRWEPIGGTFMTKETIIDPEVKAWLRN